MAAPRKRKARSAVPQTLVVAASLRVLRFDPETDKEPRWQRYEVELPEGSTVLEALMHVQDHQDGSLTFRRSCRHAICGSCGMRINGCARLACNTQLAVVAAEAQRCWAPGPEGAAPSGNRSAGEAAAAPAPISIEPLGNMPVVKDLVTDMTQFWAKLRGVQPWLQSLDAHPDPDHERPMSPETYGVLSRALLCVECGCCFSDCCSVEASAEFVGPTALAKAFRYAFDTRDDQLHRRMFDLTNEHGLWECTRCYFCTQRCPKHLRVRELITALGGLAFEEGLRADAGARRAAGVRASVLASGHLDEARMTLAAQGPAGALARLPQAARAAVSGKLSLRPLEPVDKLEDVQAVARAVEDEA